MGEAVRSAEGLWAGNERLAYGCMLDGTGGRERQSRVLAGSQLEGRGRDACRWGWWRVLKRLDPKGPGRRQRVASRAGGYMGHRVHGGMSCKSCLLLFRVLSGAPQGRRNSHARLRSPEQPEVDRGGQSSGPVLKGQHPPATPCSCFSTFTPYTLRSRLRPRARLPQRGVHTQLITHAPCGHPKLT